MTDTERDYAREMHNIARVYLTGNEQPNALTAREMVGALREQDPDLLDGWMRAYADAIMTDFLNGIDRADRARARRGAKARTFANAVLAYESGDLTALAPFDAVYQVRGKRVRIGSMTRDDHLTIADRYEKSANHQKFLATVHRAIASRLDGRTTEEVFSPEEFTMMFSGVG